MNGDFQMRLTSNSLRIKMISWNDLDNIKLNLIKSKVQLSVNNLFWLLLLFREIGGEGKRMHSIWIKNKKISWRLFYFKNNSLNYFV